MIVFVNRIEVKTDILETLETRLSSWNKMRRVFALVLKFKTNLLTKAFLKRDKTELHQQIGTSEQLLSIAGIETAGKNGTEESICRRYKLIRLSNQ